VAGTPLSGLLIHSNASSKHQQAGFTLLELLIVVFIISLISAGFVKLMVGFGSSTQSLENETKRLHRLLTLTAQEAILQGSGIGLLIEANGYRFVTRGEKFWVIFDGDDLLKQHQLPEDWRIELKQDGEIIPPAAASTQSSTEKKKGQPEPFIEFYASGEMTAFQLRIYSADNPLPSLIEAQENGEITMHIQESEE